jgi:hypothetical protein
MSELFVAGGLYQGFGGEQRFILLGAGREGPPYLMVDSVRGYFGDLSRLGHLYRVEKDRSLSLVAPSPQALEWGIVAPEKVTLEGEALSNLLEVLN